MSQVKTNRYGKMFAALNEQKHGAFVPFVTIGDPGKEQSIAIIKSLIDGGADALELGIPFSDPIADGPVIQKANIRALNVHINTQDCFDIIKQIRQYNADIPIGLLLYSNLVFKRGIDTFYKDAKAAGIDSILVADVPLHESKTFRKAAMANGVDTYLYLPPLMLMTTRFVHAHRMAEVTPIYCRVRELPALTKKRKCQRATL